METMIVLNCMGCSKKFERSLSKHKYKMNNGGKFIACSKKCVRTVSSKFYKRRKPKMVNLKCFKCNKIFNIEFNKTYLMRKRKSVKQFCSSKCKNNFQRIGGELSPSWKGGRRAYPSLGGYVMLRIGPNKRMFEHRFVAEKKIGRRLKKGEVVHHINGIVDDNRQENLVVCRSAGYHSAKYHPRKHKKDGKFTPYKRR